MGNIKNLKVNLEQKIVKSKKVIIIPHIGVDFDAISSAVGISLVAKHLKTPSYIVIDDPIYKIDRGVQIIIDEARNDFSIINRDKYLQMADKEDLYILTDVNKSTLINMKNELVDEDKIIIIDHHNTDENTINSSSKFIDSTMSSASEIVVKILNLFKIKYSREIANYLLAGIYLDTNKLTKNVSSDTMKVVAKLLENGANMNTVTDLFTEDFNSDRRVQELVSKAKIITYSIALILADEENEYSKEELAKAADYLLKYKVDASFAIGNIGGNTISISARSKEKLNVGELMKEVCGGGNQFSGAAKITDTTIKEVGKKLIKIIKPPYYI